MVVPTMNERGNVIDLAQVLEDMFFLAKTCIEGQVRSLAAREPAWGEHPRSSSSSSSSGNHKEQLKAVVAVPLGSTDAQRQAFRDAATRAGINVLRCINDTTAAMVAHSSDNPATPNEIMAVAVHVGSHAVRAALYSIEDGIFEVLHHATVAVPSAATLNSRDLVPVMDRAISGALDGTNVPRSAIQHLVLTGTTIVPTIDEMPLFGLIHAEVHMLRDPSHTVAAGSARQAQHLSPSHYPTDFMCIFEVSVLTIAVATADGLAAVLVARNTTIPTVQRRTFTTAFDGQTSVRVPLVVGQRALAADNLATAIEIEVHGIRPRPRGVPKILVEARIDADNSVITVRAAVLEDDDENDDQENEEVSPRPGEVTVRAEVPWAGLTKDDIERMIVEAEREADADEAMRDDAMYTVGRVANGLLPALPR
ncbi:Hsp70 protein-domain-containing protein [Blastocladiella britannica]|nr:Hsp70 protein-domain-containing protein [Blastocladiella britannica]